MVSGITRRLVATINQIAPGIDPSQPLHGLARSRERVDNSVI